MKEQRPDLLGPALGDLLVICGTGWIMLQCSWMLKPEIDDIEKRSRGVVRHSEILDIGERR